MHSQLHTHPHTHQAKQVDTQVHKKKNLEKEEVACVKTIRWKECEN